MDCRLTMYGRRSKHALKPNEVAPVDVRCLSPSSRCALGVVRFVVDWQSRRYAKGKLQTQTLKCGFAGSALFVCPLPATAKKLCFPPFLLLDNTSLFTVACSECYVSSGVMLMSSPRLTSSLRVFGLTEMTRERLIGQTGQPTNPVQRSENFVRV